MKNSRIDESKAKKPPDMKRPNKLPKPPTTKTRKASTI